MWVVGVGTLGVGVYAGVGGNGDLEYGVPGIYIKVSLKYIVTIFLKTELSRTNMWTKMCYFLRWS